VLPEHASSPRLLAPEIFSSSRSSFDSSDVYPNYSHVTYLRSYRQSKLSDGFTSGVFAAVVIHRPGTAEGEASTARVRIESLTRAGSRFVGSASSSRRETETIEFMT